MVGGEREETVLVLFFPFFRPFIFLFFSALRNCMFEGIFILGFDSGGTVCFVPGEDEEIIYFGFIPRGNGGAGGGCGLSIFRRDSPSDILAKFEKAGSRRSLWGAATSEEAPGEASRSRVILREFSARPKGKKRKMGGKSGKKSKENERKRVIKQAGGSASP